MSWRERRQTQNLNYLSFFYSSSNRACSVVLSLQLCVWWEIPFQSSPPNGGHHFRVSSHLCARCPTNCPYPVVSGRQLTLFLLSIQRPLLTVFPFESPSANQNSWSIRFWYVSFFLTQASLIILQMYCNVKNIDLFYIMKSHFVALFKIKL